MIYLKNAQQLDCMRKSGALLYEVLCRLREASKLGYVYKCDQISQFHICLQHRKYR